MKHLFNVWCEIHRGAIQYGEYNRPTIITYLVGKYPARLSRNNAVMQQGTPQTTALGSYRLYLPTDADIAVGDIVKVNGVNYVAGLPYNLRTHIEVDLRHEVEV